MSADVRLLPSSPLKFLLPWVFSPKLTDLTLHTEPIEQINNSKGGVMLHELSHATGGTADHVYGCQAVQGLSAQQKGTCADNYQVRAVSLNGGRVRMMG